MPRITLTPLSANNFRLPEQSDGTVNGQFTLLLNRERVGDIMNIQFMPGGLTSGQAALSVSGDGGRNNLVDLTVDRVLSPGFKSAHIDIDITGVNAGAALQISVL